jgi:hypothetical protein
VWSLAEKRAKARPDGHCSAPTPRERDPACPKSPGSLQCLPCGRTEGLRCFDEEITAQHPDSRREVTRGDQDWAELTLGGAPVRLADHREIAWAPRGLGTRAMHGELVRTRKRRSSPSLSGSPLRRHPPRGAGPRSGSMPTSPAPSSSRSPGTFGEGAGDLLGAGGATHRDAAPGPAGAGGPAACGPPRQGQGRQGPGGAAGPGAPPRGHPRPDPVGRTVPQALRGPGNSHGDRGHSRGLPSRASAAPVG